MMTRCPGQDMRYWTPDDIFDVRCPYCANEIEFWKDEPMRICKSCDREVRNPRIDLGCAEWCKHADECVGKSSDEQPAGPIMERLYVLLERRFSDEPERLRHARELCAKAEDTLPGDVADPRIIKATACLIGSMPEADDQALFEILQRTSIDDQDVDATIKAFRQVTNGRPRSDEATLIARLIDPQNGL